jgi:retinol dehydrogenase 12
MAVVLAEAGTQLVLAGRSRARTEPVLRQVEPLAGSVSFVELDLASLASVRRAASRILELAPTPDLLINNGGLAGHRGSTEDGFELHFGVNHLGHFLLTTLLMDGIRRAAPARIVTVASGAHYRARGIDFSAVRRPTRSLMGYEEYAVSKLANVLFSHELGRRLEGTGVTTYAVHPGTVATDIWRRVPQPIRWYMTRRMYSVEEGAAPVLHFATAPEYASMTRLYCHRMEVRDPSEPARDQGLAEELWRRSEEWVGEG